MDRKMETAVLPSPQNSAFYKCFFIFSKIISASKILTVVIKIFKMIGIPIPMTHPIYNVTSINNLTLFLSDPRFVAKVI